MKKFTIIISLVFALFFVGCKPTEKGYKAAYDAALGKREAAKADIGIELPDGALQQVDGAQLKEINGVKVYVQNQLIRPIEEGKKLPGRFNVAVGTYKMVTNCKSQAQSLIEEGYEAFAAKDPEGMYYTIAGSFPNVEEAIKFYQNYKSNPNRVYVGLPSSPVIIFSPL